MYLFTAVIVHVSVCYCLKVYILSNYRNPSCFTVCHIRYRINNIFLLQGLLKCEHGYSLWRLVHLIKCSYHTFVKILPDRNMLPGIGQMNRHHHNSQGVVPLLIRGPSDDDFYFHSWKICYLVNTMNILMYT